MKIARRQSQTMAMKCQVRQTLYRMPDLGQRIVLQILGTENFVVAMNKMILFTIGCVLGCVFCVLHMGTENI